MRTIRQVLVANIGERWTAMYDRWSAGQDASPSAADLAMDAWFFLKDQTRAQDDPFILALSTMIFVLQENGWDDDDIAAFVFDYIKEVTA